MSEKREQIRYTSPEGVAVFPCIHKPSKKYNKFECKLVLDPNDEELQAFIAKAEAIRDKFFDETKKSLIANKKGAKAKELKSAPIVVEEYDDQGNETGMVLMKGTADAVGKRKDGSTFNREVHVFDAAGKRLKKVPAVFGGSRLKMAVIAFPYYSAAANQVGISLRLEAVQIIELVSGGGSAQSYGFGSTDGYVADDGSDDAPAGDAGGDDEEGGDEIPDF